MNEHIKRIGEQNKLYMESQYPGGFPNEELCVAEGFAYDLIQECIRIVADAVDQREPASTYVNKIKQHFGVE